MSKSEEWAVWNAAILECAEIVKQHAWADDILHQILDLKIKVEK